MTKLCVNCKHVVNIEGTYLCSHPKVHHLAPKYLVTGDEGDLPMCVEVRSNAYYCSIDGALYEE